MKISKNSMIAACAAGLLFLSPGSSLAYQTDSRSIENTFSVRSLKADLKAALIEPSWNPEEGLRLVPGRIVSKDPQIVNQSGTCTDELAAACISFRYPDDYPDVEQRGKRISAEDMRLLSEIVRIDYNSDRENPDWIRFDGESETDPVQHFYYRHCLKKKPSEQGESTVPLFTMVRITQEADNARFETLQAMKGFDLIVEGCVVEAGEGADRITAGEAYLHQLFSFACP